MPVYSVKAHKEIVNSIDGVGGLGIGDGAPEIVTGSRDGKSMTLLFICVLCYVMFRMAAFKIVLSNNIKIRYINNLRVKFTCSFQGQ